MAIYPLRVPTTMEFTMETALYRQDLTENLKAYYDLWRNTLHRNNCKAGLCTCFSGAKSLTDGEKQLIKNGKPSLPLKVEEAIFERAFSIHSQKIEEKRTHGNGSNWSISPTWTKGVSINTCDCFEIAMAELIASGEINIPQGVVINIELLPVDDWYPERY